jgi:GMP synthase-like glutamine amidotransferase
MTPVTIGILAVSTGDLDRKAGARQYPRMFARFLRGADPSLAFAYYDVIGAKELPRDMDECDAYLITGSRHSAFDDEPWIRALSEFIRSAHRARKKLIGICFGHQVVAHALGGKAERSPKGWGLGRRVFAPVASFPWMRPALREVALLYSHRDQVTKLPPGAARVGGDAFCRNMMFVIGGHVLCFQGHPEFTARYLRRLMAGRRDVIPPPVYADALRTLDAPDDSAVVARWIVGFVKAR